MDSSNLPGSADIKPSSLSSMKTQNAWGSTSSIQELMRRQAQRQRPESAKIPQRSRPPSGRRNRPQSAKESVTYRNTQTTDKPENKVEKPKIAVLGTKFNPSEKPPVEDSKKINYKNGWTEEASSVLNRKYSDPIQTVLECQTRGNSAKSRPPKPPTSRSVFLDEEKEEQEMPIPDFYIDQILGSGEFGKEKDIHLKSKNDKQNAQRVVKQMPESIALSIPRAAIDLDEDQTTRVQRLSKDFGDLSVQNSKEQDFHVEGDTSASALECYDQLNEEIFTKNRNGFLTTAERNHMANADSNKQFHPHTKSRPSSSFRRPPSHSVKQTKKSRSVLNPSTVTTEFDDYNDYSKGDGAYPVSKNNVYSNHKSYSYRGKLKKTQNRQHREAPDVETLVSQITLDDDNQNDAGLPKDNITIQNEVFKTIKTFELSDAGVQETKFVSSIGATAVPTRTIFVAPKPRPQSAKSNELNNTPKEQFPKKKKVPTATLR